MVALVTVMLSARSLVSQSSVYSATWWVSPSIKLSLTLKVDPYQSAATRFAEVSTVCRSRSSPPLTPGGAQTLGAGLVVVKVA